MERAELKKFICGFMGCGKSTILKELSNSKAKHLDGFEFIDLDSYIFDHYSKDSDKNLADYINRVGFEKFRADEKEALTLLLSDDKKIFLSLGGGSLNSNTYELLNQKAQGFWLATDFKTCYQRIKSDLSRPLAMNSKEDLEKLYKERVIYYSKFQEVNSVQEILHDLSTMV